MRFGCTSFPLPDLSEHSANYAHRYKDPKFGGTCWKLNDSHPLFDDLGCNNKVSSLRVGPGTTVILFANSKYGGDSIEFNQDASSLGSKWNDLSSSAKVLKECGSIFVDHSYCSRAYARAPAPETPGPGEVYVYRDGNFESFVWRLKESHPDVSKLGARRTISSVRLGPGTEAVLYDDVNYSGKVQTISKNSPSIGDFNDKVHPALTLPCPD